MMTKQWEEIKLFPSTLEKYEELEDINVMVEALGPDAFDSMDDFKEWCRKLKLHLLMANKDCVFYMIKKLVEAYPVQCLAAHHDIDYWEMPDLTVNYGDNVIAEIDEGNCTPLTYLSRYAQQYEKEQIADHHSNEHIDGMGNAANTFFEHVAEMSYGDKFKKIKGDDK
jgi:hypothetical protein